ncbi:Carboxypeptidase B [Pseudolycoriella hygida]|uniref:Zinc carboxypeptidase A 1 n=1 Tax=Pseudolycoriella hygida TaxID=35572 RepID=A0A9Q0RUH9_9DIPT|nr:Carboxypeptidase B [Pseudolycoriella hygida]
MSLKLLIIFVHLHILLAVSGEYKSYVGYKVYQVTPKTKSEQNHLRSLSLSTELYDFWSIPKKLGEKSNVLVPPKLQETFERFLRKLNITYAVAIDDVETRVQRERFLQSVVRTFSQSIKFNRYYRYDEITHYFDNLARKYPKLVTVKTVGKSFENRDIKAITISKHSIEPKNTILVDAGIHAREWIAPATALYIVHELVENYAKNKNLLKNLNWVILPVVNPDGYEYSHTKERFWRKTRKPYGNCIGTDPNRNFDFHWNEIGASSNPCSETFRGENAFSETEAIALRDLMRSISRDCKFYLSLHSYGQYMLYPWGYTESLPETWKEIDDVAQSGASAIRKASGSQYTVGSSTNVLYAAAGGSDDYALGVEEIPISITMELPSGSGSDLNGFDPSPNKIQSIVEESWIGIKAMASSVDEKFRNATKGFR